MLGTMALTACQFMEEPGMAVQIRESKHPYNNNTNFEVSYTHVTVQWICTSWRRWKILMLCVCTWGTSVLEVPVKCPLQSCFEEADAKWLRPCPVRNMFSQAILSSPNSVMWKVYNCACLWSRSYTYVVSGP